ncbi:MAG: phospholipase D-like domain-containing protein [Pseudomonadota bacterium]|nr:phospholipase D-like domain-containing protein [Pseudomonadota bacterium]
MKKICLVVLAILFLALTPVLAKPPVVVYFSPNGGAEKALVQALDQAQKSIQAAVYYFTSRTVAKAILRAGKRGVKISVILDGNDENEYSKGYYLSKRGIVVRYARGLRRQRKKISYGLMHDKFAVIDGHLVVTGSYNWTVSAERWNYENLLVIDSVSLASRYEQEFNKIWSRTFIK